MHDADRYWFVGNGGVIVSRGIRTKITDKEGSLAMWSWIMWHIIHDYDLQNSVSGKKKKWVKRHKDKVDAWVGDCWLCERHTACEGCPLGRCTSCTHDTAYSKVVRYYHHHRNGVDGVDVRELKARALEGCREILRAIEQEEEK